MYCCHMGTATTTSGSFFFLLYLLVFILYYLYCIMFCLSGEIKAVICNF